jgi:hypothetical protein
MGGYHLFLNFQKCQMLMVTLTSKTIHLCIPHNNVKPELLGKKYLIVSLFSTEIRKV